MSRNSMQKQQTGKPTSTIGLLDCSLTELEETQRGLARRFKLKENTFNRQRDRDHLQPGEAALLAQATGRDAGLWAAIAALEVEADKPHARAILARLVEQARNS